MSNEHQMIADTMEWTDVRKPGVPTPTVQLWKGEGPNGQNPIQGWQICEDRKRTRGKPGKVMPIIISRKVGQRFNSYYEVTEMVEESVVNEYNELQLDAEGNPLTVRKPIKRNIDQMEAKGFRPVRDVVDKLPSREVVDLLVQRGVGEITEEMDRRKAMHSEIQKATGAFTKKVLVANDFQCADCGEDSGAERLKGHSCKKRGAARG